MLNMNISFFNQPNGNDMHKNATFQVSYDGEAVEDGTIDVRELAPSLLALGDLIDETNRHITQGRMEVSLRVSADIERGSFLVRLEIATKFYEKFVEIFSGPDATAITTFLTLLGISGAYGIFQLVKDSKGAKPKNVIKISQTTKVKLEFDNIEPIEVEKDVYDIYNNFRARSAISRIVRPLKDKGIDVLKFIHGGRETIKVTESEIECFRVPEEREGERISESEIVLRILNLAFQKGNKWKVTDGSGKYFVSISDIIFLKKIEDRQILFGKNDCLRVRLQTRQWYENKELKSSHEIIEVLEHIPASDPSQMSLLEENTDADDNGER